VPLTIETLRAWVEYLCRTHDPATLLERLDMTDITAAGDQLTVGRALSGVDRVRSTVVRRPAAPTGCRSTSIATR
jgi:hypothetical protein